MVIDSAIAKLKTPDAEHPQALVALTDNEVLVYVPDGGRAILKYRRIYTVRALPTAARQPITLTMEDGAIWEYWKSSGCGCGSPLRSVPLYGDIEHNKQPDD